MYVYRKSKWRFTSRRSCWPALCLGKDREKALQGGDQFFSGSGFRNVPVGKQPGASGRFMIFDNGKEKNFGSRRDSPNFQGSLHAVHHGHVDVQQNEIGIQGFHFFNGLLAILGLAANVQLMPSQKAADGPSRKRIVIND